MFVVVLTDYAVFCEELDTIWRDAFIGDGVPLQFVRESPLVFRRRGRELIPAIRGLLCGPDRWAWWCPGY